MNGRIKIAMVLGTLIILIIGVSCITGENFTHNDAQHYKHNSIQSTKSIIPLLRKFQLKRLFLLILKALKK